MAVADNKVEHTMSNLYIQLASVEIHCVSLIFKICIDNLPKNVLMAMSP